MNLRELTNFDPEKGEMTAHYSAVTLHRKCPQAWYYRYGLGLEKSTDVISPERDLGIWWSALRSAESIARGMERGTLIQLPRKIEAPRNFTWVKEQFRNGTSHVHMLRSLTDWWRQQEEGEAEAWEERLGVTDPPEHIREMFDRWWEFSKEDRKTENPLGAEVFWKRPLPRPEKDVQWSLANFDDIPTLHLLGYVDEIYIDESRGGMIVIRDHKTSKTLEQVDGGDDMMDPQLPLYTWGVLPLLKRHGLKAPGAVAYDRARSKAPTLPTLTAAGKLSKSVTDYTLSTYERWAQVDDREQVIQKALEDGKITEDMLDYVNDILNRPGRVWGKLGEYFKTGKRAGEAKFGIYEIEEAEIERLKDREVLNKWNLRTLDPVNPSVVRSHLRSAVDTAMDIWQTQVRAEKTGEAARNYNRMSCSWCDFKSLCQAQMVGGSSGDYDLYSHGLKVREKRK